MLHIKCGDGVGKTTSAVGQAVRMLGYNKKVIMSYWTICRMKTTKKIYVKVSIIFLLGGILLFSSCEKEENQNKLFKK